MWYSLSIQIKTDDRQNITELLLKMALCTHKLSIIKCTTRVFTPVFCVVHVVQCLCSAFWIIVFPPFDHCIVCPSSYDVWLLPPLLSSNISNIIISTTILSWCTLKINMQLGQYRKGNSISDLIIFYNKRLLHGIFHIGPGISPRLPYQARQRSWSADTSNDMQKMSCHNLFITYFTLTFFKHSLLYCSKDLWTDKLRKKILILPLLNL
jgi:hypothetical protein